MPQIQLDDQVFETAQRRALDAGYASVDEYISDMVVHYLPTGDGEETPDLDHLFTPERLEQIDKALAEIQAGNFYTTEQAAKELAKRREEWLLKNPL